MSLSLVPCTLRDASAFVAPTVFFGPHPPVPRALKYVLPPTQVALPVTTLPAIPTVSAPLPTHEAAPSPRDGEEQTAREIDRHYATAKLQCAEDLRAALGSGDAGAKEGA